MGPEHILYLRVCLKHNFRWFAQVKIGTKKKCRKIFVWCKVAKMGEKVFFFLNLNHILHIPADIFVSFPVIILVTFPLTLSLIHI